MWGSSPYHKNL